MPLQDFNKNETIESREIIALNGNRHQFWWNEIRLRFMQSKCHSFYPNSIANNAASYIIVAPIKKNSYLQHSWALQWSKIQIQKRRTNEICIALNSSHGGIVRVFWIRFSCVRCHHLATYSGRNDFRIRLLQFPWFEYIFTFPLFADWNPKMFRKYLHGSWLCRSGTAITSTEIDLNNADKLKWRPSSSHRLKIAFTTRLVLALAPFRLRERERVKTQELMGGDVRRTVNDDRHVREHCPSVVCAFNKFKLWTQRSEHIKFICETKLKINSLKFLHRWTMRQAATAGILGRAFRWWELRAFGKSFACEQNSIE